MFASFTKPPPSSSLSMPVWLDQIQKDLDEECSKSGSDRKGQNNAGEQVAAAANWNRSRLARRRGGGISSTSSGSGSDGGNCLKQTGCSCEGHHVRRE